MKKKLILILLFFTFIICLFLIYLLLTRSQNYKIKNVFVLGNKKHAYTIKFLQSNSSIKMVEFYGFIEDTTIFNANFPDTAEFGSYFRRSNVIKTIIKKNKIDSIFFFNDKWPVNLKSDNHIVINYYGDTINYMYIKDTLISDYIFSENILYNEPSYYIIDSICYGLEFLYNKKLAIIVYWKNYISATKKIIAERYIKSVEKISKKEFENHFKKGELIEFEYFNQ